MIHYILFFIAMFALSEYLYNAYKESKYYTEEFISISVVDNKFVEKSSKDL
jgi:hypothetical protein